MHQDERDRLFMQRALSLARRGRGRTSPNPMVGAVVVRKGKIVGEGLHPGSGQPHAEVFALKSAGTHTRGATLYVTLEPCCHTQKLTPPCVPTIVQSGLKRVIIGMKDPNPKVSGRGIAYLRKKKVEVNLGVLESEVRKLNEAYTHFVTTGQPFVILKIAATLDGRIAAPDGSSQWITGEKTRRFVHQLRSEVDAVVIGIGTLLVDDPMLTTRIKGGTDPLRIVLDSRLQVPPSARLFHTPSKAPTVIVTTPKASSEKSRMIQALGADVWTMPEQGGRVDLSAFIKRLSEEKIVSLMVEGGSQIAGAFLREGYVNKILFFLGAKLMGGEDAQAIFSGRGASTLAEAIALKNVRHQRMGDDLLVEGYLQ